MCNKKLDLIFMIIDNTNLYLIVNFQKISKPSHDATGKADQSSYYR